MKGMVVILSAILVVLSASHAQAIRLKDMASVKGVRNNQLIGYGLVVGLDGTGDGSQAAFTTQGLINMLENMGVHVNEQSVKVKNVAGVMISATLPPFVKTGQSIDVTVSSLGDCSSLQGGTLIATPLKGLDGQVYAIAQGAVSIGGFESTGVRGAQKKHLTVARIPSGATVEREVALTFAGKKIITISLDSADFTTISRTVNAIDAFLGGTYATAKDGATVDIVVPEKFYNQEVTLLAALENLSITPDASAKVVLDERTGTVVMGENVRISHLALSHGNLSLQITAEQSRPRLPNAPSNENISARDLENRLVTLSVGTTLGEVVRALNSVGVTPRDLISIFQSIKASGALQADLEII
ncbi:MAG: flagellar basal body P-ring protein FlgI [Proteobacteria bacterium]|nr:flagellar basal body P-ring protein FlgI [Pseudomonadota bacterium]MBU1709410.1 flagellar basal body P-ring protein FlgI [Pseudomonadota bacterium]